MAKRNNIRREIGIPPVSPGDATSYNASLQTLYAGYRDTLGSNRTQASQFRQAYRTTAASLMAQQKEGLIGAEANAIDRGVLGSTGDYKARTDVRSQIAAALAQAANTRDQGLLGIQQANQSAYRQLQMGSIAAQQGLANAQAAEASQNLLYGEFNGPRKPSDLKPEEQQLLVQSRSTLQDALSQYLSEGGGQGGYGRGGGTGQAYQQLLQAWRQRNALRKSLGLEPLPVTALGALIQRARDESAPPGTPRHRAHGSY